MQIIFISFFTFFNLFSVGNGVLPSTPKSFFPPGKLYNQTIVIPQNASPELEATANDLALWLKKGTGRDFKISAGKEKSGIVLLREPADVLPTDKIKALKNASRESFCLFSKNDDTLLIGGNSDDAVAHGVYEYLEKLGFRWFMPGELWSYTPEKLSDITLKINELTEPFYKQRWFGGTGGFIDNPTLDPENAAEEEWAIWQKRNQFGRENIFGGHVGEGFNLHNQKALEAHPEFLAEVGGKRVAYSRAAKLCVSNPNARKLFIEDRLREAKGKRKKNKGDIKNTLISVEPADGDGHCECSKCLAMGSVSDRVFFLANEVQAALKKDFPEMRVNLFAYNDHAQVPGIKIDPAVQVGIAPYVFQRFASAESLFKDWAAKVPAFYVRDYWGIAIWQRELPGFGPKALLERYDFWKHFPSFRGFIAQSSYSKGAVGPTLYLASRIFRNKPQNPESAMSEFYEKMFGKAAEPIRRMMKRWDENFTEQFDLPLSFADVEEAFSLATDDATRERITDYMAYLNYLYLYYDLLGDKKKVADGKEAQAEELVKYIWGIHDRMVLHSSRIQSVLLNRLMDADSDLKNKWALKGKKFKPDTWKDVQKFSSKEIRERFKKYKSLADKQFGVQGLVSGDGISSRRKTEMSPPEKNSGKTAFQKEAIFTLGKTHSANISTSKNKSFLLNARKVNGEKKEVIFYLTLFNSRREIVFAQNFSDIGEDFKLLKLPVSPGEEYQLDIRIKGCYIEFKIPGEENSFAFREMLDVENSPSRFFFNVAPGQEFAALKLDGSRSKIEVFSPDGKAFPVEPDERGVLNFKIPAGQNGQKWMFSAEKGAVVRVLTLPSEISIF